jgi:hypothetical protein
MDRKSLGRFEVVGVALVFPMVVGSSMIRGQRGKKSDDRNHRRSF